MKRETRELDGIVAIPGAPELLRSVAGVPHALVTSATPALARARMHAAGLPMPDVVVTADDVAGGKPDPEGFLTAAARLGVPSDKCLVFEDSAAGIAAARTGGMRVVGVGAASAAFGPDRVIADLTGVSVARDGAGAILVFR